MMVCKFMLRVMVVTNSYVLLAQESQQQKAAEPSA